MRTLAVLLALGALLAVAAVAALDNQWEASHALPPCDAACQERQARAVTITLVPRTVAREWLHPMRCRVLDGGGVGIDVECAPPDGAMDPPPEPPSVDLSGEPVQASARLLAWLRCTGAHLPDWTAACGTTEREMPADALRQYGPPAPMPR